MQGAPAHADQQSENNEKKPEKRRRTTIACGECRKKRIKCDGNTPCDACVKSMTLCMKSRKVAKRGPKAGYVDTLEARIKQLESLLTPEQWLSLAMLQGRKSITLESISLSPKPLITYDQDLKLDLLTNYFNYDHHKVHFLHEHSFMQNIRGHRTCLLNAMYALGSRYQAVGGLVNPTEAGNFYYELAVNELKQITVHVADYDLIGTYLLLMLYDLARGNVVIGSTFYSRGCKLMIQSGFHEDLVFYPDGTNSHKISETDREIRRRLFWLYYETGLCGSFVLGKTPILPENIYHGNLPMDDESFDLIASLELRYGPSYCMRNVFEEYHDAKGLPIPFPLEDISLNEAPTSHLAHLMRIMKVFEKIQYMNRLEVNDDIFFCPQRSAMLMDQIVTSLQNWLTSYKSWTETKQGSIILPDYSTLTSTLWSNLYLNLMYNFCVICIYRPMVVNGVLGKLEMDDVSVLNSKLIVAEAAGSISDILKKHDLVDLCNHVHPFIYTILFQLGITYSELILGAQNFDQFDKYKQELDLCAAGLNLASRYYLPSKKKWDLLRKISNSLLYKKSIGDITDELMWLKESVVNGYPLIETLVPMTDVEEYKNSRKVWV